MKSTDSPHVSAIVVSHNSENTLKQCLQRLVEQEYSLDTIVIVDSGSTHCDYLTPLAKIESVQLITTGNIGFSQANNLGLKYIPANTDFVIFINPDLFLPADFISQALAICTNDPHIGILSGRLLGYDLKKNKPTGRLDSTGIQRKWYGRWYDRGQGDIDSGQYSKAECMPALCGALLFCRYEALQPFAANIFDPDFFLYKEDIELGLRMRKAGWDLWYHPDLIAYHCRGWDNDRGKMPYGLRLLAAKSEVLLYTKHPSLYMLWALLKYGLVRLFRL